MKTYRIEAVTSAHTEVMELLEKAGDVIEARSLSDQSDFIYHVNVTDAKHIIPALGTILETGYLIEMKRI